MNRIRSYKTFRTTETRKLSIHNGPTDRPTVKLTYRAAWHAFKGEKKREAKERKNSNKGENVKAKEGEKERSAAPLEDRIGFHYHSRKDLFRAAAELSSWDSDK